MVSELIKEDPPFDDVHQLKAMITVYKKYINSYHELEGVFRKRIIASLRYEASTFIRVPFFKPEERQMMKNPKLEGARSEFQEWYSNRHKFEVSVPMSEKVEAKGILKKEIPERYPSLKYQRLKDRVFFLSFVEKLYDDTQLLLCFSKSNTRLDLYFGVTEPNGLKERYLCENIGNYFGGGYFTIDFNSQNEFDQGRADLYKFLDFFLPKFKNALLEARQEWTKVGS